MIRNLNIEQPNDKNIVLVDMCILDFYKKLRHRVIFPKGPPFSIFTAVTFHYRVREGSMWIHYAIKHLSQLIEIFYNLIKSSIRSISISQLNTLLYVHLIPIKRLV